MDPILEFRNLTKTIPGTPKRSLFANISAKVAAADKIAILGVSGQGKSTLLRILSLLVDADHGDIALEGKASSGWQPKDWRSKVCYFSQRPVMLTGTVEDNLSAASRLHRQAFDRELAERLLSKLGFGALDWSKDAGELSGGEKQRIALARGLLLRPNILLLDETTASLDSNNKLRVEELLQEWHERERSAMIWVTHDPEQARRVSGRVWFLADGALQEDTDTAAFFSRPSTDAARAYLQIPPEGADSCL